MNTKQVKVFGLFLIAVITFVSIKNGHASEINATNFITVATGRTPSKNDPLINTVNQQLNSIRESCASTTTGAGIHDKLVRVYSDIHIKDPSLLVILGDFVVLAKIQCRKFSDTMLATLYLLERNEGASHSSTIAKLSKNPAQLIKKWSSRPAE